MEQTELLSAKSDENTESELEHMSFDQHLEAVKK